MQLLGSKKYLNQKLETLGDPEVEQIKTAFRANRHPKFQKAFQPGTPYGTGESYEKLISEATREDIAKLIVYVAQLLQTKVYLFYDREV